MNRNKRLFSVLLGGLLALNTCVPAFAVGTGSSNVTLQVETGEEPSIVSVKVPTEIPLKMDKEGTVTVPQDLSISNLSDETDVELTGLSVTGKNGWMIKAYSEDLAARPEGTKELSMAFRGDETTNSGDVSLTPNEWIVNHSSELLMNKYLNKLLQTNQGSALLTDWRGVFQWNTSRLFYAEMGKAVRRQ